MLTGIVLARDESSNIKTCLESLKFCDKLLVIDDNSSDDTVKIAQKIGATVTTRALNGDFAAARNWALNQADTSWVLFIDADEIVSSELGAEIKAAMQKIEFKGFALRRLDSIWGKTLRHGDVGNVWLTRLARRGAGQWQGRVHETWEIEGRVGLLKNPLLHYPHPDVVSFLTEINHYSTLKASEFYSTGRKTNILEIIFGPVWRFIKNYFFKLGFLDGTRGFIHAMMMAFYQFLVAGKLWLLYKGIGNEVN